MERHSCSIPCLTKAWRRALPDVAVVSTLIFEQGAAGRWRNTLPAGCRSGRCAKQWSLTSRRLAWCITRIAIASYALIASGGPNATALQSKAMDGPLRNGIWNGKQDC
jgi:hypothetical protein